MYDNVEFFKELILNSNLSAEEIYEKILSSRKNDLCTKKIYRDAKSWKNCIYQGAIGEDDFLVVEASSSSVSDDNIAMRYNDYRDTMIRFIEEFRTEWRKHPDYNIMQALVVFSVIFARTSFYGAGRDHVIVKQQRNNFSQEDEQKQMKQYEISKTRGEGNHAVCCERNSTIGNMFQFAGYEVFQISGELIDEDESEGHFFTLVKHGPGKGYYSVIDAFNQIVKANVLPADYDFSKGFKIDILDKRRNRTFTYILEGPLLEMTDEILQIETDLRRANKARDRLTTAKYKKSNDNKKDLKELRASYERIQSKVTEGNYEVVLKDRYVKYIQFCLKQIDKALEEEQR